MQVLDVTIYGVRRSPDGGARVQHTARVGWEGEWVTDGDPATITAQRNEIASLFPDIEIRDMVVIPE